MCLGEGWWVRTVLLWDRRGLYGLRRGLVGQGSVAMA